MKNPDDERDVLRELNSDEAVLELLKSHEASRIIEVLK